MIIPDMTTLRFSTKVYEAEYAEVKKGLKAYIKLKNRPNEVLHGQVDEIGVLPDPSNWYNRNIKIYSVYIKLDKQIEGLTPNMTGEVELELARQQNVLQIPISAIFTKEDKQYCWRVIDGKGEKVEIQVGRSNDSRVEILSGLDEGDKVMLIEPEDISSDNQGKSTLVGTAGDN